MRYTVRFTSANFADHYCTAGWSFYPASLPMPESVKMDLADAIEASKYLLEQGATQVEVEAVK